MKKKPTVNKAFNAVKIIATICILLLSSNGFSKENQLDSVRIISYDINYKFVFNHPTVSDLKSFIDNNKDSAIKSYVNICFFTTTNKDELNEIEDYLSKLKPQEQLMGREYWGKGARVGLKFFYKDHISFVALEPKYSKYVYMNNSSYGKQKRFCRCITRIIKKRYKSGECGDDS